MPENSKRSLANREYNRPLGEYIRYRIKGVFDLMQDKITVVSDVVRDEISGKRDAEKKNALRKDAEKLEKLTKDEPRLRIDYEGFMSTPQDIHERQLVYYNILRSQIEHEDNLVNQRLTWTLTGQGLLFIAYSAFLNTGLKTLFGSLLLFGIGSLGIVLCWTSIILIYGALASLDRLHRFDKVSRLPLIDRKKRSISSKFPYISGAGAAESEVESGSTSKTIAGTLSKIFDIVASFVRKVFDILTSLLAKMILQRRNTGADSVDRSIHDRVSRGILVILEIFLATWFALTILPIFSLAIARFFSKTTPNYHFIYEKQQCVQFVVGAGTPSPLDTFGKTPLATTVVNVFKTDAAILEDETDDSYWIVSLGSSSSELLVIPKTSSFIQGVIYLPECPTLTPTPMPSRTPTPTLSHTPIPMLTSTPTP